MLDVSIKDIPDGENYLFAKKTTLLDRNALQMVQQKKIKFVITDKGIYYKIANVLIDLTGTCYIPFETLSIVEKGKYLWAKKLTFFDKNKNKLEIIDKESILDEILEILRKYNVKISD